MFIFFKFMPFYPRFVSGDVIPEMLQNCGSQVNITIGLNVTNYYIHNVNYRKLALWCKKIIEISYLDFEQALFTERKAHFEVHINEVSR